MRKRIIAAKVLSGEPTDGSGRICIHLFIQDEHGPYIEPHAIHPVFENGVQVKQKVECHPTRGRLACNARINALPTTRNGITYLTHRTDDPHAVTCPKCKASKEWRDMMVRIENQNI